MNRICSTIDAINSADSSNTDSIFFDRVLGKKELRKLSFPEFSDWDLYAVKTVGDGSCLLHAMLQGFYVGYGKVRKDRNFMSRLRNELADKLSEEFYSELHKGHLSEFSKDVPEFTRASLQNTLRTNQYLGYGFLDFLSKVFDKDIYIISHATGDLYPTDEHRFCVTGKRESLVLLYSKDHFETIGVKTNKTITTQFSYKNKFIKLLRRKL